MECQGTHGRYIQSEKNKRSGEALGLDNNINSFRSGSTIRR
jgi:hypothetical protein